MRNLAYFQRASQGFRYFRAGIKLRFQLNTNPQNYGCVIVSYWPNILNIASSIYDPINAKPHIMDVSATQALEIVIPYIHHMRWLDIPGLPVWNNLFVRYEPFLATVQTQTIPVTLQVWASFVDPEFDGAYEQDQELKSQAQSEIQVVERDSPNAIVTSGALPLAVLGTTGAISAYQTVSSLVSSFVTLSTKVEAVEKGSTRMRNLFKQSPETFKEPMDLRPQYIGSIASLTQNPTVTLDAYPRLKFPPCELGDPNLIHRVLDVCKIPTIRQIQFLTTAANPVSISYQPGDPCNSPHISYMDMMACMYRYWRGSIKVNVKFFTSPLISGRVILRVSNSYNLLNGVINENETPYRKIVTIKGTTEISVTLPFIYDRWWKSMANVATTLLPTFTNNQLCELTADIISPLTSPGDLEPQVLMVVSIAAGDDFQLKGYTGWRNSTPVALVSEAQSLADEWSTMNFESFCGSPLSHLIDIPENDDTVELLLSRYSGRPAGVNFMDVNNMPNLTDADNFDYIIRMFRYWRGSVKFKAFIDWEGTTPATTYWEVMMDDEKETADYRATTQGISRGCAFNKSDNGAPIEFTQPYFSDTEWTARGQIGNLSWNSEPMSVLPLFLSGSNVDRVILAAGHDFQLAYLLPPFVRNSSAYVN